VPNSGGPFHVDLSDKEAMREAIDYICKQTGLTIKKSLLADYVSGRNLELLNHDKLLSGKKPPEPALGFYLICMEAWLLQPNASLTFDIYRSSRIIPLIRALAIALQRCSGRKVKNLDDRIGRLTKAHTLDQMEAVLFEILCASRYAVAPGVSQVEFIREDAKPRPDLAVTIDSKLIFIECKKFDRLQGLPIAIRNVVRQRFLATALYLRNRSISAVIEITFNTDPRKTRGEDIHRATIRALESGVRIQQAAYSVAARRIQVIPFSDSILVVSPAFHSRYDFRSNEWQGIVNSLEAHYTGPTWVDKINWEFAAKWKIANEEILWRHRRLNYDLLFKGIKQLNQDGGPGIMHVWIERDLSVGDRSSELIHFVASVKPEMSAHLSWLVFNEIIPDVTPAGRFEFVEHTHPVSGPCQIGSRPIVENVFVEAEDIVMERGEFGVGAVLPPLDEVEG
jgi:hypothetical protein